MLTAALHQPVLVDRAFDDPGLARRLVIRLAPYLPVQRYFANEAEAAVHDGSKSLDSSRHATHDAGAASLVVYPNFRGDWAYDVPLVEGVEPILHNERFATAARELYGGAVVVPQIVYSNITAPMGAQPVGHTDIPAFRGVDRTQYPTWILVMMGSSRLFEDYRVRIATAVSWFYDGVGGGFSYWPDGPDGPRRVHEPPFTNTAIVGDNDFMFHRVEAIGPAGYPVPQGLTTEAVLAPVEDNPSVWEIRQEGATVARYGFEELRISVSWKAKVFADEEERRVADEHLDDIAFDEVLARFAADFAERGEQLEIPADPLTDVDFITALAGAYRRAPSTE